MKFQSQPLHFTRCILPAIIFLAAATACAQITVDDPVATGYRQPFPIAENRGSVALSQVMKKLTTRASVLMITAHPDDEDGATLAYLSRGLGARVGLLTLTRGEGGQNLMSGDLWDALGLIRMQELLAADQYYGVTQFWGTVVDFGFSKTREETLAQWGEDRALCDTIRAVRLFRPMIILSPFTGNLTDGHGHHQVAGQMAQEAYLKAGDPAVCPAQITDEGLTPWQPLKVYARVPFARTSSQGMYDYATQKWSPIRFYIYIDKQWHDGLPTSTISINVGQFDPLLGETYAQLAAQGLGQQRSQHGGPDVPGPYPRTSEYHLYASRVNTSAKENSFFDGIDMRQAAAVTTTDPDLQQQLVELDSRLQAASDDFVITKPEDDAQELIDALNLISGLIDYVDKIPATTLSPQSKFDLAAELSTKREYINDVLVLALHLSLQATADGPANTAGSVVPGDTFSVTVHAFGGANLSSSPSIGDCGERTQPDAATHDLTKHCTVTLAGNTALTRLPLTHPDVAHAFYNFSTNTPKLNQFALTQDGIQPAFITSVDFGNANLPTTLQVPVEIAHHLIGQNTFYEPLTVVPAINITLPTHASALPFNASFQLPVHVQSNVQGPTDATVNLQLPAGWQSTPQQAVFHSNNASDSQIINFAVQPAQMGAATYSITASADYAGRTYAEGYTIAGYPGLQRSYFYQPATFQVTGAQIKIAPNLKIGYVMGTGDNVPQSLALLGVPVTLLSFDDLATGDLSRFDEIILGVRAYTAPSDALAADNARLLEYAQNGGVVIAQYGTAEFDHGYGPYPFSFGGAAENVVDETAPVTLLNPQSPLLSWPNQITSHDFDNWIEERGHSFMRTWDSHYEPLTETHDPGQDPQRGGLLIAHTGKGIYVYVAYALYRQLPAGVPGAARIFANLLSLPKYPGR
jgi:LmbE family N-acetylglucosaminyl deacetylase